MSNALVPVSDIQKMAQIAVASKLFGVKNEAEAMALMLLAQAEGMHPMRAVQQYHIISGKPAMKAEAILARFQAAGGKIEWTASNETKAAARFLPPGCEAWLIVEWTIERASKIKVAEWVDGQKSIKALSEKDVWKNYPAAMLRARVISEGVRATLPGCILGIMAAEEITDHDFAVKPAEITIGATVTDTVNKIAPAPKLCTPADAARLKDRMRDCGIVPAEAMDFIIDRVHRDVDKLSQLSPQEIELLMTELDELKSTSPQAAAEPGATTPTT